MKNRLPNLDTKFSWMTQFVGLHGKTRADFCQTQTNEMLEKASLRQSKLFLKELIQPFLISFILGNIYSHYLQLSIRLTSPNWTYLKIPF